MSRLQQCREAMIEAGLASFLITNIENVRYLTGFTGSAGVCLLTRDGGFFVTDGRYRAQSSREIHDLEVQIEASGENKKLIERLRSAEQPVGFEADHVSVTRLKKWEEAAGVPLQPTSGIVERLRLVKDADEIAAIRDAVHVADETFQRMQSFIKPGLSERDLAAEIDYTMRRLGASASGFETIVASGPNSALPHARPSDRALAPGDLLTLDFGATVRGYNSDITRTLVIGTPDPRQQEIYEVVLEALLRATEAIRPGLAGKDVDEVARSVITAAGYGEAFSHGLGHSLGRSVHDGPGLGRTEEGKLQTGMVITVEPGIYIEGFGGVRIEDDVLVTSEGVEVLTKSERQLIHI